MEKTTRDALASAGFETEQIVALESAEGDDLVQNWHQDRFTEVLGQVAGLAAFHIVRELKVETASTVDTAGRQLPDAPPYLKRDKSGNPVGYDPTDPTQFWTDPATGELWRWDGKRAHQYAGQKDAAGRVIPQQQYPFGKPNRVMIVKHRTVDGVAVPDPEEAAAADLGGYDWFHQGYGVWIGNGGKAYRDVPREVRRRVIDARARAFGGTNPAIVRA